MYFFRFDLFLKVSLDCCYSCCTLIGAILCIIGLPFIIKICSNAIYQPDLTICSALAVILIIYLIVARAVILSFKNIMYYKINGEVYNMDEVNIQNQNIDVPNQEPDITFQTASTHETNNFESSETDLPPSYTECVISSPPNKVQIPDSEPPPPYYYV